MFVVDYVHTLSRQYAGGVEKVFIDSDATYIVEACLRYGHAVYL